MGVRLEFRREWWGSTALEYTEAWALQRSVHAQRVAGEIGDTVLMLEHPAVFTAGKRTERHERPTDPDGPPVIDVDRGGKITFHGPGQLVAYPIVALPDHVKVVDYVRRVEEATIRTARDFGVSSGRVAGRSGVWIAADDRGPERKIGAVGIRVAGGVTMHGISLNADVDLSWFDRFVPCGISDAGVTSLTAETDRRVTAPETADRLAVHLSDLLAWEPFESSPDIARPAPLISVVSVPT